MSKYLLPNIMKRRSSPEDMFTELFVYLLRDSPCLRKKMAAIISLCCKEECKDNCELDQSNQIDTQVYMGQNGGYADIVWDCAKCTLVIEAKISAGWQENQPEKYLKSLENSNKKEIVFCLMGPNRHIKSLTTSPNWEGLQYSKVLLSLEEATKRLTDCIKEAAVDSDCSKSCKLFFIMEEAIVIAEEYTTNYISSKPREAKGWQLISDLSLLVKDVQTKLLDFKLGRISSGDFGGIYNGFKIFINGEKGKKEEYYFCLWLLTHDKCKDIAIPIYLQSIINKTDSGWLKTPYGPVYPISIEAARDWDEAVNIAAEQIKKLI